MARTSNVQPYRPIRPTTWLKRKLRGRDLGDVMRGVVAGILIWAGIVVALAAILGQIRSAFGLGR